MRKILLLFCLASSVSCHPQWWDYYAVTVWYVKNGTEETLILKCPYADADAPSSNPLRASDVKYREFEMTPGVEVKICRGMVPLESKPWFNYYFTKSAEAFGEDVSWQILSEDGTPLKTWAFSDRNLPNQRFFEESEWRNPKYGLWYDVLFEIISDDIK